MTFASPWALAGLLLAIPLLLLHLRRPRPETRKVGSLLAWRDTPAALGPSSRRLGRPRNSWMLLLQLLGAGPARPRPGAAAGRPRRRIGVDDAGLRRRRLDLDAGAPGRRDPAEERGSDAARRPRSAARGRRVAIFLAGPETKLLYEGGAGVAGDAVRRLPPTFALRGPGRRPCAWQRPRRARAARSSCCGRPRTRHRGRPARGSLRDQVIGSAIADQGSTAASRRCLPGSRRCQLFARVESTAKAARTDRVEVLAAGRPISEQSVRVAAGGSSPIAFELRPGRG